MKKTVHELKDDLRKLGNKTRASFVAGYFKTGPGEYGEGDVFLGVTVPEQRTIAKKYTAISLSGVQELLKSPIHEFRLTALLILVAHYKAAPASSRKQIVNFYLKNTRYINNWDLVDTSAPYILGQYYAAKNKTALHKLCRSKSVWERRMAIVATYAFIKRGHFKDTLSMAAQLLDDPHDLIHKATGWMLREIGNKDKATEVKFLDTHAHRMPRTMLRYAIEKFDSITRSRYLKKRGIKKASR